MGIFVSIEGGEGVGKSSQANYLSKSLKKIKEKNIITREPGGTKEAEIIRSLIVNEKYSNFLPETELLLIYASRHEHLSKLIIPTLKTKTVICELVEQMSPPMLFKHSESLCSHWGCSLANPSRYSPKQLA